MSKNSITFQGYSRDKKSKQIMWHGFSFRHYVKTLIAVYYEVIRSNIL